MHLKKRGASHGDAERAVAALAAEGLLDDERFARALATEKRESSGWGAERIEGELVRRGVIPEIAARTVTRSHEAELEAAVRLLERRYHEPLADDRARTRALGFLVRKGYQLELGYEAIRAHGKRVAGDAQVGNG